MEEHKTDISKCKQENALFVHIRDNPGHSFNFAGAELIYKSNHRTRRQLVESSLIISKPNINLKPGDFPTCRLTAPLVLQSCLNKKKIWSPHVQTPIIATMDTPASSLTVTSATHDSTDLPSAIPAQALISSQPASVPPLTTHSSPTSCNTDLTHLVPLSSVVQPVQPLPSTQSQPSLSPRLPPCTNDFNHPASLPIPLQPPATPPVSQRTRSHRPLPHLDHPPTIYPASPHLLQSQARALLNYPSFSTLLSSPFDSPVAGRTHRKLSQRTITPYSPYPSPLAITGATRKGSAKQCLGSPLLPVASPQSQKFFPHSQRSHSEYSTHKRKRAKPY